MWSALWRLLCSSAKTAASAASAAATAPAALPAAKQPGRTRKTASTEHFSPFDPKGGRELLLPPALFVWIRAEHTGYPPPGRYLCIFCKNTCILFFFQFFLRFYPCKKPSFCIHTILINSHKLRINMPFIPLFFRLYAFYSSNRTAFSSFATLLCQSIQSYKNSLTLNIYSAIMSPSNTGQRL